MISDAYSHKHSSLAVQFVSSQASGAAPGYSTTASLPSLQLLTHVTVQTNIDAGFWAYMRTLKHLKSLHVALDLRAREFADGQPSQVIDLQPLGSLRRLELQDVVPHALVVRRGCNAVLMLSGCSYSLDAFLSTYNKTTGRTLQSPLVIKLRGEEGKKFYYKRGRVLKTYKGTNADGDEVWGRLEIDRLQNLGFWSACWGS
jgi:hypothetical protein